MKPDGDCLFTAILEQVIHPTDFTSQMLRHQTTFYMIQYAHIFFPLVQIDIGKESYESYLMNIYDGSLWADDIVIAAIGRMYNLSITIVSPRLEEAYHTFHDSPDNPDVILIANGGPFSSECSNTHYLVTKLKVVNFKKPSSSIPEDRLKYYTKYDYNHGRNVGAERLVETEKQHAIH